MKDQPTLLSTHHKTTTAPLFLSNSNHFAPLFFRGRDLAHWIMTPTECRCWMNLIENEKIKDVVTWLHKIWPGWSQMALFLYFSLKCKGNDQFMQCMPWAKAEKWRSEASRWRWRSIATWKLKCMSRIWKMTVEIKWSKNSRKMMRGNISIAQIGRL